MVKIMENPTKMDDLGGKPTIFGNIQIATFGWENLRRPLFPGSSESDQFLALQKKVKESSRLEVFFLEMKKNGSAKNLEQQLST